MTRLIFSVAAVSLVACAAYLAAGHGARAAGTNPDAMSIDMNPAGNTATSLGSREACARINENNVLDADEDVVADTVSVDVTVTNIPASDPMITFNYVVNYDESRLTVQTAAHDFRLFAGDTGGSSAMFNASDPLPDTDGDDAWTGTVIDIETTEPESGSGVLSRLTISSDSGAANGTYPLTLSQAAVIDLQNDANPPDTINNASIAIGQGCAIVQGDVDCSGSVSATDSLKVLRHIAGLSVSQQPGCPLIGTGGPPLQGDVDCSGGVQATDSLKILRYVAGLPVVQNEPPSCDDIGT